MNEKIFENLNIDEELEKFLKEFKEQKKIKFKENNLIIIGGSTSEIIGYKIGENTNEEIAYKILSGILEYAKKEKIKIGIQCCEHLNRAIVIEKEYAIKKELEIVNVLPTKNAGGGFALAAFKLFKNPVVVEKIIGDIGIDIGDTFVGMHIKFVQVPLRLKNNKIGKARINIMYSRKKMIGGKRANYEV